MTLKGNGRLQKGRTDLNEDEKQEMCGWKAASESSSTVLQRGVEGKVGCIEVGNIES